MTLRKRLFAKLYDRVQVSYERGLGDRRRDLLRGVRGRVLELGPGTGVNFGNFASPEDIEWYGVEPNPHMRRRLSPRAREHGIEPRYCELSGYALEAEAASFDAVVSTLVLCSVPDVNATLSEIRRVLRPGGRFLFMEHVAAPRGTARRLAQGALTPCWRWIADGCRLNRELGNDLERAGFADLQLEAFENVLPHVSGQALR